jgi:type III pantothenate kinase
MLLTIDAGNTRTKWALFSNDGAIKQSGASLNALLDSAALPLQEVSRVFISNVAGETHANFLETIFTAHNLAPRWLKSSAESSNVINHYQQPETLGTDRWASLVAAWHIQHSTCVVVNAGTAVTIDALFTSAGNSTDGEFIGGMILPGLTLMQTSLGGATAQLPNNTDQSKISGSVFNTNTAEAITNGALNAVCGAICHMITAITEQYQVRPLVMLSGGDAQQLMAQLSNSVTNQVLIVDNLVLIGLYLLERSQHPLSDKQ